jgi:putative salt-induced outer membrane protein YdiY
MRGMNSRVSPVWLALLGVLAVAPAAAQETPAPAPAPIVHSNPPALAAVLPARAPASLWSTKAEVSYVSTSGNADTTTAKLGGETQYKPGAWTLLARGAFLTSTAAAADRNRRVDGLLRTSRTVSPRLEVFGQIVYLQNTFAGIGSSFYPLGGVAYALVETPPHSWKARVGLGYGQESRLRRPDLSFATADAETAYRWALSKTAEFRHDATFTSNLSRTADWRFANATSVSASLNSLLSLKVQHALNYLNQPVAGFERVDTVTSAAVVATF